MSAFPPNLQKDYLIQNVPDVSWDCVIHFFLIDYKYMFKNPYTFDEFVLLIISPSLCSQFAICFTGDISQKLVS